MFTGLIEEIGTVTKLEAEGTNLNLKIQAKLVMDDMKLGDSIAIDGVCQTVTKIDDDGFWVTAIAETLKLTNFGDYKAGGGSPSENLQRQGLRNDEKPSLLNVNEDLRNECNAEFGDSQGGSKVNLERCLKPSDRFGGHIVAGHIDGVGKITKIQDMDGSKEFFIEVPSELSKYIVYKGSIAVSGISLTVASIEGDVFSVCIIPKTLEMTTLGTAKVEDKVNIEPDVVAKYVEKFSSLQS